MQSFTFNNGLSEINRVLGNLSKHRGYLTLQFGIWMSKKRGNVGNCTCINNSLSMFSAVLGDITQRGGSDAFEGKLRLLNTKN